MNAKTLFYLTESTNARLSCVTGSSARSDHLNAPVMEESSTRTEGPNRVVDLLTVLSGRAVMPSNASADPGTHDLHRMLLTWCRSSTVNLVLLVRP